MINASARRDGIDSTHNHIHAPTRQSTNLDGDVRGQLLGGQHHNHAEEGAAGKAHQDLAAPIFVSFKREREGGG